MGDSEHRISAWWVVPLSALAWWAGGFLPWIVQVSYQVTGLAEGVAPGPAGFLPLPFEGDDGVVGLVVMALMGGLLAGVTARVPASAGAGAGAAITGTLLAMGAAGSASWWLVTREGLPDDDAPLGMLVVTGVAGVVGLGAGLPAGLGPGPLRGLALALPVVLLDAWVWGFVPGHPVSPVGTWWILAVALGVAFGLAVDSRPIELLGWLPTAGAVWVLQAAGPALLAVQENIWPGSPLTEDPLLAVRIVWREIAPAAIDSEGHQLGAWVVALLLGAAVAALRLSREASDEAELTEAWA
ncbi:hypothetical protein ACIG47_01415 [Promicromonospora sp. NPDC052451]|uniref:hypothetical protein n=1 Tax=Promicromonospora sp. NPDC052451 TaxID=3364407 RepID=UPI0037C90BBA